MTEITTSPWGAPQTVDWLTGDKPFTIAFVSTASHGGYYVAPSELHRIPLAWREASFNKLGMQGWFEEDCDWVMVALIFTSCFIPQEIAIARRTAEIWLAPKLYRGALEGY
jgi:hypothetical protein